MQQPLAEAEILAQYSFGRDTVNSESLVPLALARGVQTQMQRTKITWVKILKAWQINEDRMP